MTFIDPHAVNQAVLMCYNFVSSFTNYDMGILFGCLILIFLTNKYLDTLKDDEVLLLSKFGWGVLSYIPLICFIMNKIVFWSIFNYIKLIYFNI